MRRLLWLGGALALLACGDGELRFSTVVQYAETKGFDSPIAVGRMILVALENSATAEPLGELSLVVEPPAGGSARVFPVGLATFGVILEAPGSYQLIARDGEIEAGSLTVTAEEVTAVRLSETAIIVTVQDQGTEDECGDIKEDKRFDATDFVLHPNQTLELAAVPLSASGEPLLGLLPLSADTDGPVRLSAVELRQDALANAILVAPEGISGEVVTITFSEATLDQSFTVSLQTSAEPDARICL